MMLAVMLVFFGKGVWGQTAIVTLRPTHIDLTSATSESAVLMTLSAYPSDDVRYRLYNGGNQYNCWDESTDAYISSTSYSAGPQVPGTPSTTSIFWIVSQRGNNNTTVASYRDRLGPGYGTNYKTAALPAATAITTPFSLTGTFIGFGGYDNTIKHVVLGFDGATLVTAAATTLSTGAFVLVCPDGTTIDKIEIRAIDNTSISIITGTWTTSTNVGSIPSGGNTPPSIVNIVQTPSSGITSSTTVSVSADISDADGTISLSQLKWGTSTGVYPNTINMTLGSGSTYTTDTDIPAQANGTTVYYVVYAEDNEAAATTSLQQNYSVIDPAFTTLPYSETFDADLGACYPYTVDGTKPWSWVAGEAVANGYLSSLEEQWLVIPGIDFDSYNNEVMTFTNYAQYGTIDANNYLKLFYSADYLGIGDPTTSTWTELLFDQPAPGAVGSTIITTPSGNIDLSGISGTSVYLAFKYYSTDSPTSWKVDDILIQSVTVSVPQAFAAASAGTDQIDLTFTTNLNADDVVIVYNGDGTFTDPSGVPPVAGQPFAGGTLLYSGAVSPQSHTGLTPEQTVYYKAFSYDGINYSPGLTDNATTDATEPTNHATNFTATTNSSSAITVAWTDAVPASAGYLIKGSDVSYVDIAAPVDGVAEVDALLVKNIAGGVETVQFTGLTALTPYYFKIFPYNGTGGAINYKTDGSVPEATATTTVAPTAPTAWINELHYDNAGTDVDEFVEVVLKNAGDYTLADFQVDLYNGYNGASYSTKTLDLYTLGNTTDGFTFYYFDYTSVGIQNGAPDGLALSYQGTLISGQFLSYEGSFAATDGPANGVTSTDIGVSEPGSPIGESLQLGGYGNLYSQFYWQSPLAETPGAINNNQTIGSYTTWTGVTDSDWASALNWNNGVPDALQNVIIPTGLTNYPTLTSAGSCNNLTIESSAIGDGSLMGQGFLTVNGTTTIQRYTTPAVWHGISGPLDNDNFNSLYFGGNPEVWGLYYIEATRQYDYETDLATDLGDAKGWMVWVGGATPQNFNFTGDLRSGTVGSVDNMVISNADGNHGYNFVGNPFPSSIDWNVIEPTTTGLGDGIWIWNDVTDPDDPNINWVTYSTTSGGLNGGTRYIALGQAFFVQVDAFAGSGTLQIAENAQIHNNVAFMKDPAISPSDLIKLKLSDGNRYDESIIRLDAEATEGYDGQLDMHKMFSWSEEQPQLYSTANNFMAINVLPKETVMVPMDVRGLDGNEMTIALEEVTDFAQVYLSDEYTGIQTNLMEMPYSFIYDAGQTDRFTIYFTVVGTSENQLENIRVYSFDQKIRVIIPMELNALVEVVNMLGQTVIETDAHLGTHDINMDHGGYYLVNITSDNQRVTRKVFIK